MSVPFFSIVPVFCLVEVFAPGRSLVQRSPTDCDVLLCVIQIPERRPWPALGCWAQETKKATLPEYFPTVEI
jgi:hypothetical protein